MAVKSLLVVLNLWCFLHQAESAPHYYMIYPHRHHHVHPYTAQPRPLSIGDWINQSEWFPIEINVPDTISNIANGISGITGSISSGVSGITGSISNGVSGIAGLAQRIPFIHRLTSSERPRPMQYFILIPSNSDGRVQHPNEFDPFAPNDEVFSHFP